MDTIIGRVLALVITALAIVGVYDVYANSRDSQNNNDLIEQVAQIEQAVTSTYQRSNTKYAFNTATIPIATMTAAGLVPGAAIVGGAIVNPLGGTYAITPSASPNSSFIVSVTGLTPGACLQLLQSLSNNTSALGYTAGAAVAAAGAALPPAGTTFSSLAAGGIEGSCTTAGNTVANIYFRG